MSPIICSCVVCGFAVADWAGDDSWTNQFRGLCSGPEGLMLTGLGVYTQPWRGDFIAAPYAAADADASWNTAVQSDDWVFGANHQGPRNGRHGFLFHAACWSLLERYFRPDPVPLPRLFEVLQSLPFTLASTPINWGHDYGGLVRIHDQAHYPWEDRYEDGKTQDQLPSLMSDPFNIAGDLAALNSLVTSPDEGEQRDEDGPDSIQSVAISTPSHSDCFTRLPAELFLSIALLLPTVDALHMRLASRAFYTIFHDPQFWASRFRTSSTERPWLWEFEGKDGLKWRCLYRETHLSRLSPALRNRRRIWLLIKHMAACLTLNSDGLAPRTDCARALQQDLDAIDRDSTTCLGVTVSGDLKELRADEPYSRFDRGCRAFHKRKIRIPEDAVQFSVSINVGEIPHIAGLNFTTQDGQTVSIGYKAASQDLEWVEISRLCGLNVAVGSKGIQALRCIDEAGKPSSWLGNLDDSVRTKRLAQFGCNLHGLVLGFDGCKMTSMTAYWSPGASHTLSNRLRTAALWYPDIPSPSLDQNEDSFIPHPSYLFGFNPLVLSHFGGPGGKYLRHLTRITVAGVCDALQIAFFYDDETRVAPFGRTRHLHKPGIRLREFAIDGPGGEAIVTVDGVYQVSNRTGTTMEYCKFTTNRGRSLVISDETPKNLKGTTEKIFHVSAPFGTTITGLYGAQDPDVCHGIVVLGVVSEASN